jgi:hypothetical protein
VSNPRVTHFGLCITAIVLSVGCGSNNPQGTPSALLCTTGTTLVLVKPLPGSRVPATTGSIEVASNYAILNRASLAAASSRSSAAPKTHPLEGPVPAPTPSPTPTPIPTSPSATPTPTSKPTATPTPYPTPPFQSPVYYEAKGFVLRPQTAYQVEVAIPHADCLYKPIRGAIFYTRKKF